jgi:hypothetical protein
MHCLEDGWQTRTLLLVVGTWTGYSQSTRMWNDATRNFGWLADRSYSGRFTLTLRAGRLPFEIA